MALRGGVSPSLILFFTFPLNVGGAAHYYILMKEESLKFPLLISAPQDDEVLGALRFKIVKAFYHFPLKIFEQ